MLGKLLGSRLARVTVPVVLAAVAGGAGVVGDDPEQLSSRYGSGTNVGAAAPSAISADRVQQASRNQSAPRASLMMGSAATAEASGQVREIKPKIADGEYVTTALNVWTGPGERFTYLRVLESGSKVSVTENVNGPWAEIVQSGKSRWVRAAYLSDAKPEPQPEAASIEDPPQDEAQSTVGGISSAPCSSGSSVESGLTPNAVLVYRSVCANFPEVTSYGGVRSDGDHSQGLALDIMVSSSTGDAIAEWVRANSSALGVSEVLWAQQIWTVQRSSEGWRPFSDRGSATANHYDHVHVTVYGN